MIFTRDLTTNRPSRQQKTIDTKAEAETGADVKGAERCYVETSKKVRRTP